jgi:hypothetical protein
VSAGSLEPQRRDRIDFRCTTSWNVDSSDRDRQQKHADDGERQRVIGANPKEQALHHSSKPGGSHKADRDSPFSQNIRAR